MRDEPTQPEAPPRSEAQPNAEVQVGRAAPRGWACVGPVALGLALAAVFLACAYPAPPALWARLDFNAAPFEDFIGPYFTTARALPDAAAPTPGYHYPAFFALLLAPLAAWGPAAASWVWLGVELAATAALVALPLRFVRAGSRAELVGYGLLVGLSHPLAHNLYWGQVSTPITLALLVAVFARRRWAEDALIATAAAVKLVPASFWLAPLAAGSWRRVVRGGVWATLLVAVPAVLVMGPRNAWTFHVEVAQRLAALGAAVVDPEAGRGSQDLGAAFGRWSAALGADGRLGFVVGRLIGLVLAVLLVIRAAREPAPGLRFAALALLGPLLVAPVWSHGLAFVPAAAWFVWRGACAQRTNPADRWRGLTAAAAALATSLAVHAAFADPETHARAGLGAAAVLALAGGLLVSARFARGATSGGTSRAA